MTGSTYWEVTEKKLESEAPQLWMYSCSGVRSIPGGAWSPVVLWPTPGSPPSPTFSSAGCLHGLADSIGERCTRIGTYFHQSGVQCVGPTLGLWPSMWCSAAYTGPFSCRLPQTRALLQPCLLMTWHSWAHWRGTSFLPGAQPSGTTWMATNAAPILVC